MPMIVMTTSSSTSVKPRRRRGEMAMARSPYSLFANAVRKGQGNYRPTVKKMPALLISRGKPRDLLRR
jgi:hypothetical protein